MAWQLLAAALPYAAQAAGQYINRPREEEFKPQTGYMKKYLSHLRGRQADREVYHMAMRPALRAIGGQSRKMQRQIGYQTERAGVSGSGIEAQQRLTAGQMTMGAMQEASEKATAAQMVESRRLGDTAADVTAKIGAEEERASQAYKTAKSQWGRQMVSTGLQAAGALAGQGISQGIQNKESLAFGTEHLGAEKVKSMTAAGVSPDDIKQIAQDQYKAELYWTGKLGEGTLDQYLSQKYLDVEGAGDGADTDPSAGVQEVVTDNAKAAEEAARVTAARARQEELLKGDEAELASLEEIGETTSGVDPRSLIGAEADKEGSLAALQRFLPGGKTGKRQMTGKEYDELIKSRQQVVLREEAIASIDNISSTGLTLSKRHLKKYLDSDDQHIKKAAEGKLKEVLKYEKKWNKKQEKIEKKRKEDLKEAMEGEGSLFKKAQEAGYKGTYWDWLYEQKPEDVSDLDMQFYKKVNRYPLNRETAVTEDVTEAVTEDVTEDVKESARGYQTETMTNEEKIKQNEELKKVMGSDYEKRKGETYAQWFARRKQYFIDWYALEADPVVK